jgi:very-short-patch-repair endonuclease
MRSDIDIALNELARRQHGLITVRQASAAGATPSAIRHRIRSGAWERVHPRVLRRSGSPTTDRQIAMTAVLASGAPLSHGSAAALWDWSGFRLLPAHTTHGRRSGYHTPPTPTLHRTTYLPSSHVTQIDGIPVLTPSRLLFQLAGSSSVARMARLTDNAWRDRQVSGRSLHEMCDELSEHGRDGMAVMREVLADRPVGYRPPDSGVEARFQQLLAEAGLPPMRRQVELGGREWLGRIDFVAVDAPLVVLVDGERWHSSLVDRAADARQQLALERAGFVVVRVTDHEVWHDVAAAMAKVRAGWREATRRSLRAPAPELRHSA